VPQWKSESQRINSSLLKCLNVLVFPLYHRTIFPVARLVTKWPAFKKKNIQGSVNTINVRKLAKTSIGILLVWKLLPWNRAKLLRVHVYLERQPVNFFQWAVKMSWSLQLKPFLDDWKLSPSPACWFIYWFLLFLPLCELCEYTCGNLYDYE